MKENERKSWTKPSKKKNVSIVVVVKEWKKLNLIYIPFVMPVSFEKPTCTPTYYLLLWLTLELKNT